MAFVTPGDRLRTHATTAFSFIGVVVLVTRRVLMCLVMNAAARKNRVVVMILSALQCVTRCIEKRVQFLKRKAYF